MPHHSFSATDSRPPGARIVRPAAVLLLAGALLGCWSENGNANAPETVRLAVAASLRHVVPDLIDAYRAKHGGPVIEFTWGASGTLRRQVEAGAPLDAVLFASAVPVDSLIEQRLVVAGTRAVVATNTLVLIGPTDAAPLTFATLGELPPDEKLAIGDPGAVPAGRYAREAMQALGVWDAVRSRVVFAGHVGQVLTYARQGEVAAAIVYATEIAGVGDIVVLDRAVGDWVPRAEVVVAVTTDAEDARTAGAFLDFVRSEAGQAILQRHGFGAP